MRLFAFIVLVVFLTACEDKVGALPKPRNLIREDEMVNVLTELTLIESHIQMKYLQVARYKKVMERSGDEVLKKYRITRKQFESSLDYYGSRQEKMQELYARVLDSLNLMAGKLQVQDVPVEKIPSRQDTLKMLPGLVKMPLDKK